nr:PREDICTED: glycine-rich cell wall structural protein 1.0-like [Linepithema humile]
MEWFLLASIFLLSLCAAGAPIPQGGAGGTGSHGQPQAGSSPSTPGPGSGGSIGGAAGSGGGGGATGFATGAAGAASFGLGVTGGTIGGGSTGGGAGGGAAASGTGWSKGPARRGRGWRDWRRGDPTLIKGLWKSKGPLDSLGQAEIYIIVALLIGFITVVIGCWLSDNCWSPEPEGVVTLA